MFRMCTSKFEQVFQALNKICEKRRKMLYRLNCWNLNGFGRTRSWAFFPEEEILQVLEETHYVQVYPKQKPLFKKSSLTLLADALHYHWSGQTHTLKY